MTVTITLTDPREVALYTDARDILAALADVMRYREPCGHTPPTPECCVDCYAQTLLARHAEAIR